jgi:hypothetical protein
LVLIICAIKLRFHNESGNGEANNGVSKNPDSTREEQGSEDAWMG